MKLYKRTDAGNAAALDPKSPLPRKLRTLLISVDGRTRESIYISTLSSFGDVAALLESLLQQGYIQIVQTDDDGPATRPGRTEWAATDVPATDRQNPASAAPDMLASAFELAGIRNTNLPSDDVSSWDRFQPDPRFSSPAPTSFNIPGLRAGSPPSSAQYQLRSAVSLMSDFVTTHLPADSLEIVLTLESLSSVEQVIASLKGYQAMIAPAGAAATRHVEELRDMLSRR
jgi:hypothetical protein